MPKRWIRNDDWQRQPHVKDGPPASLWWYRRPDRHAVVDAYILQYKRGRSLPDDFKDALVQVLSDISRLQNKKQWGQPRTFRYWSIPSYALAHRMKSATLMKQFRELEKVAKKLFPDSVPSDRKQIVLSEKQKQEIRSDYLAGVDAKELAQRYHIPASYVGKLCAKEKEIRHVNLQHRKALVEKIQETPGGHVPDSF